MDKQTEKELKLLEQLNHHEPFQAWKNLVVEPVMRQLKLELQDPLKFNEADLKAKLMHLNSLENFFEGVFEQAKALLKTEQK